MKKEAVRGFRPSPENEKRLEFAAKLGLNVSALVDEVLTEHLKQHLEKRLKKLREIYETPVP